MKQIFWLVVMVVWVVFGGIAAEANQKEKVAEVFIIDGYLPDQFSVKGVVEEKLNELVSRLQKVDIQQNNRLLISITGSADASGKLFANDTLALARAEQVAAVLSSQFPNAVVKSWSAGDNENIRKVKVVFTIEKAEVVKKVQNNSRLWFLPLLPLLLWIGFLFFLFSYIFLRGKLRRKKFKRKKLLLVAETIEMDGYVVPIEHHDGFYWSPFISKSGNPIRRESFADIKRSLKGCLENSEFASQKEKLIQEGIIKKKGGE